MRGPKRAGLRRCGAQLGTCTKVCRIGLGSQLGAIGPIGLRPGLSVKLLRSAHIFLQNKFVVYTCFLAYTNLRFKHGVLGTRLG